MFKRGVTKYKIKSRRDNGFYLPLPQYNYWLDALKNDNHTEVKKILDDCKDKEKDRLLNGHFSTASEYTLADQNKYSEIDAEPCVVPLIVALGKNLYLNSFRKRHT